MKILPKTKICKGQCGEEKDINCFIIDVRDEHFYPKKKCKQCMAKEAVEKRANDPSVSQKSHEWYLNNKENLVNKNKIEFPILKHKPLKCKFT